MTGGGCLPSGDSKSRALRAILFPHPGCLCLCRSIVFAQIALILVLPMVVEAGDGEPRNNFVGILFSQNEEVVRAGIGGLITSLNVHLGERIRRGQCIVGIDDRALQVRRSLAAAELQTARAEHELASSESLVAWQRYSVRTQTATMWSKEELTRARLEFERSVATERAASNRIAIAQLSVRNADLDLEASRITAPFAGRITALYAGVGSQVLAGTPIARVIGDEHIWVRFCVPVEVVEAVRPSARVYVQLPNLSAPIEADVRHVGADIDVPSGMVIVEAELVATQPLLQRSPSGEIARVCPSCKEAQCQSVQQ